MPGFTKGKGLTDYGIGRLISHLHKFATEPRGSFRRTIEFAERYGFPVDEVLTHLKDEGVVDDVAVIEHYAIPMIRELAAAGVEVVFEFVE